jgi:hypothetical protein
MKTLYISTEQAVLADVQDMLDTIDQAGLYVLLDQIAKNDTNRFQIADYVMPDVLLHHPADYRGRRVKFTTFLDPKVYRVKPAKSNKYPDYIYYVAGQIPFSENQRMPAIFIFVDLPELPSLGNHSADQAGSAHTGFLHNDGIYGRLASGIIDEVEITSYFYMVLRTHTQQPDPAIGPTMLDFLVFITRSLPAKIDCSPVNISRWVWTSGWGLAGMILVFAIIWVILRYRIRKLTPIRNSHSNR